MSLINKLAKYGALAPNGGRTLNGGGRALGPPTFMGDAYRPMGRGAYMGDPGIFGDIWGGLKKVAGVGLGVVSKLGIPVVSGVSGMAGRFLAGRAAIPGASTQPIYQMPAAMPPAPLALPGAIPIGARGMAGALPPQLLSPPITAELPMGTAGGYHLNKSSYFLMDGTFIQRGTKWVKNRRRNPGNMRALSRSLSRVKSAKRMTKALSQITIRKKCP